MLIDTHAHLTFGDLAPQVEAVVARAAAAGVTRILNVATTLEESRRGLELLERFPNVDLIAGIHPHEAANCDADELAELAAFHHGQLKRTVDPRRVVGVGEIGLDFHYDFAPRDRQEEVFRFQLGLASELARPGVIHAREAEERVCDILREFPPLEGKFVFHCYSAGVEVARRILDMGGRLSFTGVVTFKKADLVRRSARYAPLDRLFIETDAPYLSPEPMRSRFPNEPAYLVHTAKFLAELRGESFTKFADKTSEGATEFFRLPEITTGETPAPLTPPEERP